MSRRAQVNYETKVERGACALYLSSEVRISDDDIEAGFRWLETWDVLMPIKSYTKLADSYGDEQERGRTEDCVRDLRQPVYDERMLFIRHGSSADVLLTARDTQTCDHESCPLPMLRAVWQAKPLLLALPESWVVAA